MNPRGNTLKLTAVSALVVLGLTGFSTGRGHGGSGDGGGGGGCSSSSQNHDSSSGSSGGSHRYDDDDDDDAYDYGNGSDYDEGSNGSGGSSGSGNGSSSLQDATVELLSCASKKAPYATVEVTNPNAVAGVFTVTVVFENASGAKVVSRSQRVEVAGDDTATARVDVDDTGRAPRITDCALEPLAPAAR
ncbi:hypothetical protein [Streptomyces viridosporus]|uniref:hypothetical protein n=1 Tax=Streptomyces viridosporus TaxID=67581 RepID=UPI0009C0E1A5|nr:hypothetical protein [Streptomyces viridosporus]